MALVHAAGGHKDQHSYQEQDAKPDAVQLLHTEDWAQVIRDLLQALLVLLVNH